MAILLSTNPEQIYQCKCGEIGPRGKFEGAPRDKNPARCKKCAAAKQKKWRKDNPRFEEYAREYYLQYRSSFTRRMLMMLRGRKADAARKKLQFELIPADIVELFERQNGRCALTGQELIIDGVGRVVADTISIDRIDDAIGYIPSNIRLVTYHANMARGPFGDEKLFALCEAVLAHRPTRRPPETLVPYPKEVVER